MIIYECCSNVKFEKVYEAFQIGFSDYMIKLEISKEDFMKRFFGPEGNQLAYSFIALVDENPIGLILGGVKDYEGVKTIRCGTLCIQPEYRGKGVSQALFELHRQVALNNRCKQMFLEVIVGNDRAIKFYSNLGYDKIYDISYYFHKDPTSLYKEIDDSICIRKVDFETISHLGYEINSVHINWQNDFDYIEKLDGVIHYGSYENSQLIGALSVSLNGKMFFIWTKPQYRHRGIAVSLIIRAAKDLSLKSLAISFPNNASIEGFMKHIQFHKEKISQYEMYLTI